MKVLVVVLCCVKEGSGIGQGLLCGCLTTVSVMAGMYDFDVVVMRIGLFGDLFDVGYGIRQEL